MENYIQKWQQLNAREQRLIMVMSIVIAIFLFHTLIWQPLNDNLVKASKKLEREQELLFWVKEKTQQYQQASRNSKLSGGSLTGIVNRTARSKNINVTRMQPQGDDLQVWIDEIPFEQLLKWLEQLVLHDGVVIKAIDISKADTRGVVQVRRLQLGKT